MAESVEDADLASYRRRYELLGDRGVSLLPDPEPQAVRVPIVSVDDHLVEDRNLFVNHMPKNFGDAIPRMIDDAAGVPHWLFDGVLEPMRLVEVAVAGIPAQQWTETPVRFEDLRRGSYDPRARLTDMDLAGVAVSLCFPSVPFGFAGQRMHRMRDPEVGLAALRAYNDWVIEEWVAADPLRFIAQQVAWLPDPLIAADDIRRNAARGFTAVSFSENPERLGYPSLYSRHWDPFFAACQETGTVVNLHIGSSSTFTRPSTDSALDTSLVLFTLNAVMASVDWVYSGIPVRFPNLRIVFSESGVSWIPTILERLRRTHRSIGSAWEWSGGGESPEDVFRRAFWFTSIEDPSGIEQRHTIGIDRIMLETDYPHPDSTWPITQDIVHGELGHLPPEELQMISYKNACEVYGLPTARVEQVMATMRR